MAPAVGAVPNRVGGPGPSAEPWRLLEPALLARLEHLELVARTVVEGFLAGQHHTSQLGTSLDFAEHRVYTPGDDTRRIDWRLWARTDRLYRKEFEADAVLPVRLVLDVSRSMQYRSGAGEGAVTKLAYARVLAACLAYLAQRQHDPVGLTTFDSAVVDVVPPGRQQLPAVLHVLAQGPVQGHGHGQAVRAGSVGEPLRTLTAQLRRRSLVVLLSDLYLAPAELGQVVGPLCQRGHDVLVLHVLDRAELAFPFAQAGQFQDLETGAELGLMPAAMREQYCAAVQAHCAGLEAQMRRVGASYARFETAQPVAEALVAFLSMRQRLVRAHAC